MSALRALTIANIRSFVRDRAALFWTLAFPIVFILLFGTIFSGGGDTKLKVAWVDQDATSASAQLKSTFAQVSLLELKDEPLDEALAAMKRGDLDAVLVVPAGYGDAVGRASAGSGSTPPGSRSGADPVHRPSQSNTTQTLSGVVQSLVSAQNQALSGQPPVLASPRRRSRPSSSAASATSCHPSWPWPSCSWVSSPPSRWSSSARS